MPGGVLRGSRMRAAASGSERTTRAVFGALDESSAIQIASLIKTALDADTA